MGQPWKTFAWAAALFYAVLLSFNWSALSHRAFLQTESMLDYAMLDLDSTLNGSIDTMLMHVGESIAEELGKAEPLSTERASALIAQRDIDEVNVFDRTGLNLGSSDPRLPGTRINDNSKSAPFMVLTNGVRHAYSQPFRAGAHNPDVRRKYVGVAFPGGDGFVQVGIDETHVTRMFPSIMGFIFDEWLLGENGFFLCADMDDGHLISNPARHRNEARFLSETGYDPAAPAVREDGKTTFRQRLFGETCDCRAVIFCGHRVVAALPPTEYYATRTFYATVMAVILAIVLTVFVLLFRRIDKDADRLKAFYAAEEAARAKDMEIAKTIQTSALPNAIPASPRFRLYAAMQTAKEVGGDFYDHFPLDDTHYAFLVADVSGKGITAALYMMTAKTIIKDTLLSLRDPAETLTRVNAELCRSNSANMFLTAWVGVLDVETGVVTFANAGHNPPVKVESPMSKVQGPKSKVQGPMSKVQGPKSKVQGPKSKVQSPKSEVQGPESKPSPETGKQRTETGRPAFLTAKSGPMLAFMDGIAYKPCTVTLAPGDSLFLYTDGVTEALDVKEELFGEERLIETVAAVPAPEPHALCTVVRAAVAAFSANAPQADDITVLAIRYGDMLRTASRTFPPTQDGIAAASGWLDETLDLAGRPDSGAGAAEVSKMEAVARHLAALNPQLHIVLDEICSNIVRYSGASSFGIDVTPVNGGVRLVFIDDGKPYDPLAHADPDIALGAAERPIGGLGILMVKKMASSISYNRAQDRNFLTVTLAWKN